MGIRNTNGITYLLAVFTSEVTSRHVEFVLVVCKR